MIITLASEPYAASFVDHFASLKDSRRTTKGNIIYPLKEILFLVISSLSCGHSDYIYIEDFGEQNIDWLRKYFSLHKWYMLTQCNRKTIPKERLRLLSNVLQIGQNRTIGLRKQN